jgi:uncharacterized protein
MVDSVLVVFAKAPRVGAVKTRLVPPLTAMQAAAIYEASLRDVIALAIAVTPEVRLCFDDAPGAAAYFDREFPGLAAFAQSRGNLGQRLRAAFDGQFGSGAGRVAIIGADSPTLPHQYLADGLVGTGRDTDVTLGPTADGGYYLVSIRAAAWPRAATIFENIPWSTDAVLSRTLARAGASGLRCRLLERWYDIDRVEDLERARGDMRSGGHLARLLNPQK